MTLRISVFPEATVVGIAIQGRPPVSSSTKLDQMCAEESLDPLARRIADDGGALHEPLANQFGFAGA